VIEIKAIKYIQNGFSEQDAQTISLVLEKALTTDAPIEIDFTGVKFYTTLFFSHSITKLLAHMTKEEYERKIKVKGLSDVGEETYKHSLDYAIEFYNLSEKDRSERDKLMKKAIDEA
jgi:hypothetical protein